MNERDVSVLENRFAQYLLSKGLKSSGPRWKMIRLVLAEPGHFSVLDVSKRIQKKFPEIGAATIYRNIKLLCEAGILKESLADSKGANVYEVSGQGHHDHLVCLDCGAIFEFHDPELESAQSRVISRMNFKEVRHRHVIYAHCKEAEQR